MKDSVCVILIRLDKMRPIDITSQQEEQSKVAFREAFEHAVEITDRLRSIRHDAILGVVVRPVDLHLAVHADYVCGAEGKWERFVELVKSGAIELIPTAIVRGLSDLAGLGARLHFHTAITLGHRTVREVGTAIASNCWRIIVLEVA